MATPFQQLDQTAQSYEPFCVLAAAAELDLFTPLAQNALTAKALTEQSGTDERGTVAVLDALVSLGYLTKTTDTEPKYRVSGEYRELLDIGHPNTFIPMLRHRLNCLRQWSQLSTILQTGEPALKTFSPLGAGEDYRSFVLAMNSVGRVVAVQVVESLQKIGCLNFKCLLDVGGASGTYTQAILERHPAAKAILFDRPAAVAEAKKRFADTPLAGKVQYIAGDFLKDALPKGADFAWISAIIHQFSREETQTLYRNVFQALESGGTIAVRDFVMDSTNTQPPAGAMFAINMLTATPHGRCYSFDEYREDLQVAGFTDVQYAVKTDTMASVVTARKV